MVADIREGWFEKCTSKKMYKREVKRHKKMYDDLVSIVYTAFKYKIDVPLEVQYQVSVRAGFHKRQLVKLDLFRTNDVFKRVLNDARGGFYAHTNKGRFNDFYYASHYCCFSKENKARLEKESEELFRSYNVRLNMYTWVPKQNVLNKK